ncbi:uncharacterized protein LOC144299634 [Canis aureus]
MAARAAFPSGRRRRRSLARGLGCSSRGGAGRGGAEGRGLSHPGSPVETTKGKTSRQPGDKCPGKRVKIFTIFHSKNLTHQRRSQRVLLCKRWNENRVDNLGTPALEYLSKAVASEFEESLKDSPPTSMVVSESSETVSSLDSFLITKFMENISEEEQISIIKVASELVTAIGRWRILRMKFLKRKKPQVRKHNEAGINRRGSLVQLEYTCYFVD